MAFTSRHLLTFTAGALAVGGIASAAYQSLSERADRRRFLAPGRMLKVGGRRFHVWLEGERNPGPTVVVVPAMTTSCLEWVHVQRELLGDHRVFMFDRGGVGWSDWVPGRRDVSTLTDELTSILEAAQVPGPYVLVGHSLGGAIVQLFTYRHPERVAGLILVDTSHEGTERMILQEWGHFGPVGPFSRWKRVVLKYALRPRGLERARVRLFGWRYYHDWAVKEVPPEFVEASVAWDLSSRKRREAAAELTQNNRRHDSELARVRRPFGDLPLTVITCAEQPAADSYAYHDENDFHRRWWRIWYPLQQQVAGLSTSGKLIVAQRAGHNVQHDEPELIIDAVTDMCTALATQE